MLRILFWWHHQVCDWLIKLILCFILIDPLMTCTYQPQDKLNIRQILFHLGMCSSPLTAAIWFGDSVLETCSGRKSITFVQLWEDIWRRRHCSPYATSWDLLSQPVWSCEGQVSSVFCILNTLWHNQALYSTSEEQRKMFLSPIPEHQHLNNEKRLKKQHLWLKVSICIMKKSIEKRTSDLVSVLICLEPPS